MKRIDALIDPTEESRRLGALEGGILDDELDDALQRLVREAADELHAPIALVSIILRSTQFFRAHVGLPPDLAAARATDRDASFCQFVVRDAAPFEVTNASMDGRVPQDLVERYGIQAYLGHPLVAGEAVVGSLCVIGTEPRTFTDRDREVLRGIAERASRRLAELAHRARATNRALLSEAARPAFSELRNVLMALSLSARSGRVAAADAAPLSRLVRDAPPSAIAAIPALGALGKAADALDSQRAAFADIEASTARLVTSIEALQHLMTETVKSALVAEVIDVASRLAHHHTKLVGGVEWEPSVPRLKIAAPRMIAVSVIAAALVALADVSAKRRSRLTGSVTTGAGELTVVLRLEGASPEELQAARAELDCLIDGDARVRVATRDDALELCFDAAD